MQKQHVNWEYQHQQFQKLSVERKIESQHSQQRPLDYLKGKTLSEYKLTSGIINLSQSNIWDEAKLEWGLNEIYQAEEPETCLCGHFPIIEICVLRNKFNGNFATVGNCCVKKFIGLPSDKIFQAVKRIRKDNQKSLNAESIQHARNKRWLNKWEYDFYMDIMRKRNLSSKQLKKKIQINEKFIRKLPR